MPSAHYTLRVRAIDPLGLEGRNAQRPLELNGAPAPPPARAPRSGESVHGEAVVLNWDARPGASDRVQVARDAVFRDIVRDVRGIGTGTYRLESDLATGTYYWRVAAHHPELGEGPFSPSSSFRLMPAPPADLEAALDPGQLLLSWSGTASQARYRVSVARDETFSDVLLDQQVQGHELRLPRPSPGNYRARVSALDGDGIEAPGAVVLPIEVPPPPLPPALLGPAAGELARSGAVSLRWKAREGERYRVQVVRADAPGTGMFSRDGIEAGEVQVDPPLPPGRYAWRVAAATARDGEGGFSDLQPLDVAPPVPALDPPVADRKAVSLSWNSELPVSAYRVQIGRDAQFAELAAEAQVSATRWSTSGLAPGVYHARVQGLNEDGTGGGFSPAQSFTVPKPFPWWLVPIVPLLLLLP